MNNRRIRYLPLLLAAAFLQSVFADTVVTTGGDELKGTVVRITENGVLFIPEDADSTARRTIPLSGVFMVKYDNGEKMVLGTLGKADRTGTPARDEHLYSAAVFGETGLFGLVNIDEAAFDPGVVTVGVTPSIDRRINRILSVGLEYMILWAKPKKAPESRFIMNCNGMARIAFPLNHSFSFLAQVNAGLSIWPGAESLYPGDTTFFKDRIGWDIRGGLGVEHKTFDRTSLVLYAGYNANFTTLHDTPVTIDMLILSIGPKFRF